MSVVNAVRTRLPELDRLRGLAILLMVGDHVSATLLDLALYRVTLGRLAMPLFFVVAGHLAGSRLGRRHVLALGLGLALPAIVPFIDSPNVLVWWVLGSVVLYGFDRLNVPSWGFIVLALTLGANGWAIHPGALSYDPAMLLGLMALGRGLAAESFGFGCRLPEWVGALGRRPLSWYVGHLLVLQLVMMAVGRG